MKILVIDLWMPTPDRDSVSMRMVNLLTLLREMQWEVTFTADDFASHRRPSVGLLRNAGISVVCEPEIASIHEYLERTAGEFDVLILSRCDVAAKYFAHARACAPRTRIIFDTTDLQHLRGFRGAKVTGNRNLLRLAIEAKRQELAIASEADCTLVVSTVEQELLEDQCPGANVQLVSNIHDVYSSDHSFDQRTGALFVGLFTNHPNVDAMSYYCGDIQPRLVQRIPGFQTTVIGTGAPDWLRQLDSADIVVTGYVPDIAPHFERARLSAAPLRYGAGVKGKVLQSMGYGVPVVATSIAAEGMPAVDGRDILVADDPESFSRRVVEVHEDAALWQQLSANGRKLVADHFSFEAARRNLETVFDSLGLAAHTQEETRP